MQNESDRRAIFSFDPNDLVMESIRHNGKSTGQDSLYLVLRVYELIQQNDVGNESNIGIDQVMKHIAFGITKMFSNEANMKWPDGHVKAMQLYKYPNDTESQGAFVERLWHIIHQKSIPTFARDPESTLHDHNPTNMNDSVQHDHNSTNTDSSLQRESLGVRLFRPSNT
jgi:hypothetical protein